MRRSVLRLLLAGLVLVLAAGRVEARQSVADYVIGPLDVLSINVHEDDALKGRYTVEADGTFSFPLIGRIKAGGLTIRDFEAALKARLKDGFFVDPQVTVGIEEYRSQRVFVTGEVRTPGILPLTDWEVYFTTQRPVSAGRSVQAQSQAWLAEQGFPGACVLALRRSRGRIAHLLDLDFLIDDLAQNCVDVLADSRCRPLLMSREPDPAAEESARNLGIAVVRSMDEAIAHICAPAEPPRGGWARAMKALRLG